MTLVLTEHQKAILKALSDGPMTAEAIQAAIDYPGHERAFAAVLRRMLDKGVIDTDPKITVYFRTGHDGWPWAPS